MIFSRKGETRIAVWALPVREAVENELVLDAELARLVRDAEDDDRGRLDVPQHQRIHEPCVGVVVVRCDRHSPALTRGHALLLKKMLEPRAVLRSDALDHALDLVLEVRKADGVGQPAPLGRCLHQGGIRKRARLDRVERLAQVSPQVLDVFDPY